MTDRELLKLAAKAAGYDTSHPWNAERMTMDPPVIGLCIHGVGTNWNPLERDGAALRLRNALQMTLIDEGDKVYVEVNRYPKGAVVREHYERDLSGGFVSQSSVDAATRRAIVRAAAEIGRAQS